MKRLLLSGLLSALLMLSGCAYHLVGHGSSVGTIPADVTTISIGGNADHNLLLQLRQRLHSDAYSIVDGGDVSDQQHHATVDVQLPAPSFVPSAYSTNGVATQYRMTLSGSVSITRQGESIWQSGAIQRQGDVFVTGGPTSIESSRQRLLEDLSRQWVNDAVGRMRSGF